MVKIRNDFEGVIYVRAGAEVVQLAAGDDVPEGTEVDSAHVDGGSAKSDAKPEAETSAPKKRAPRQTKAAADDPGDEG